MSLEIPKDMFLPEMRDSYVEVANRFVLGVTAKHYQLFIKWYYEKEREQAINDFLFMAILTGTQLNEIMSKMIEIRAGRLEKMELLEKYAS